MRLADLVAAVHAAFDVPAAMADVTALCGHDRYQASSGVEAAAGQVAERAAQAGLVDVEMLRFPADGARRWWTFAAPLSWTPRRASVHAAGVPVLNYPEQPYSLAAYSAPTMQGGRRLPLVSWSATERPDPAGAMVVLEGTPLPLVLGELAGRGAAGVVTDPLAGRPDRLAGQVGRIELPPGSALFAFSATPVQLAALRGARAVDVLVELEAGTATMPVVTGRLPGPAGGDGELLLSAHLCHPMPSANDNASGVAALLGLARAHRAFGAAGAPVRFVWGPEFVGMAAYLHDLVHTGRTGTPVAAVNVDMAGEDQRRCGGPLIIERAPDELPSPLSALAERCAELVPAPARSYSGAVPCDTWAWRATPYVGASDHAMLAGPPTGCPAVGIGHWPDLANHSSADTVELVDPAELRRTATIAGATIAALRLVRRPATGTATAAQDELASDVFDCAVAWAGGRVLSALPGTRPAAPPPAARVAPTPAASARAAARAASAPAAEPVLDPFAPESAGRLVRHRGAVAHRTVRSLHELAVPGGAIDRAADWVTGLAGHVAAIAGPYGDAAGASDHAAAPCRRAVDGELGGIGMLSPSWDGPFNLRHLAECAGEDDRGWLSDLAARDRGGSYARLLALTRALDGRRDGEAAAWEAALTSELAVPVPVAGRFLRLLCRTGWARPRGDTPC